MTPSYLALISLEFEPAWLALPRERRGQYANVLAGICARHPTVKVRWFDADALGHGYTDLVTCEFDDLLRYHCLWEELRDNEIFSVPYLRIKDVRLGIERGYEHYEQAQR